MRHQADHIADLAHYGFDFIGPTGAIHAVGVARCATDEEAQAHARRELAASLTAVAVEVWREGQKVARIGG